MTSQSGKLGAMARKPKSRRKRLVYGAADRSVAAEAFRKLKEERTGEVLVAAMENSPFREIDIEPKRKAMPVREVNL
ncbi:MAG: hypothetical protein FJX45_16710 [Alphaproteobacteria bacterium]|nr:hypothetical protein [Alphaproteobacteria bacterium]